MSKDDFTKLLSHFEKEHSAATQQEKNCFAYGLLVGRHDLLEWKEEAKLILKNLTLPAAQKSGAKHIAEQFELDLSQN
jgi:hypothetical protein